MPGRPPVGSGFRPYREKRFALVLNLVYNMIDKRKPEFAEEKTFKIVTFCMLYSEQNRSRRCIT